jgi:outer membrane protein OmpA-like peptidoglycan-associated protein
MLRQRCGAAFSVVLAFSLCGCSAPVGLYHSFEGGAIAQNRQPPPGANLPYPNLADVPAAAPATPAGTQEEIASQAHTGVSAPSPGALAGLTLPEAAPPVPNVPGLALTAPPPPPAPAPVAAAPAPKPPGPPQGVAFRPGSALLPPEQARVLKAFAAKRDAVAHIRVMGFGEGSLDLALSRARRIADELTADGVPQDQISVSAQASGSGGFAQLVY